MSLRFPFLLLLRGWLGVFCGRCCVRLWLGPHPSFCGAAPSFRFRRMRWADAHTQICLVRARGASYWAPAVSPVALKSSALHSINVSQRQSLAKSGADERLCVCIMSSSTGHFVEMFSGLDVGTGPAAPHPSQGQSQAQQYAASHSHASPGLPNGGEEMSAHDASTIRRSNSSELAFALQAPGGQEVCHLRRTVPYSCCLTHSISSLVRTQVCLFITLVWM